MAAALDQDSDVDGWVHIDLNNPADSSDDDAGVRPLSSGTATPECRSDDDDDECLGPVLDDAAYDDAVVASAQTTPPIAAASNPLSGLFHHTLDGGVDYAAFEPVLIWPEKELVRDPIFSACKEQVTVLASTGGLVCLRTNAATGRYIVADPLTRKQVNLPGPSCDHLAYGDPAVVITFEGTPPHACCADRRGHYHVVVAFPLGYGTYAYESFSSRTWRWTVGAGISAVEQVVAASGVGAIGRAFWRTTLGYVLCYDPATRAADLIPAPEPVMHCPNWELGEMNGTLSVTCTDDRVNDVFITNLHLEEQVQDGEIRVEWTIRGHFEGGCLRNHYGVQPLRSQGHEVVMWDPTFELVVAMDIEGRTTRTVGPLSGRQYYSDFIPYVRSSTGIISDKLELNVCSPLHDVEE